MGEGQGGTRQLGKAPIVINLIFALCRHASEAAAWFKWPVTALRCGRYASFVQVPTVPTSGAISMVVHMLSARVVGS